MAVPRVDHEEFMEKWFDKGVELAERSTHSRSLLDCREVILRNIPRREEGRCLDFGCGTGFLSLGLAEVLPGCKVIGLDVSDPNLVRAAKLADESGWPGFFACRGSVLRMPFADNSLSVAFCRAVLIYLYDIPQAFEELRRVLAEKGVLVACEPVFRHPIPRRILARIRSHSKAWDNVYMINRRNMAGWLREAGFSQVRVWLEREAPFSLATRAEVDRIMHYSPWGIGMWEAAIAGGVSKEELEALRFNLYRRAAGRRLIFKPVNLYLRAIT